MAVTYKRELETAREAAEAAGRIQADMLKNLETIEIKDDDSPVTEVDRRCEALIRDTLLKSFPDDGFLGEESGHTRGRSGRTWIVDPIDGTRPYIRGIPTYSALVALEESGTPVVGVMRFEGMQQTYWAAVGHGAFRDGTPIRVSTTSSLSNSMGSGLGFLEKRGTPEGDALLALMGRWDYAYGFMDAYSYACVADGRLDLCVNLLDKPWDSAAPACIVAEAGGRFSDLNGRVSVHTGSTALTNGVIHEPVLEAFATRSTGE